MSNNCIKIGKWYSSYKFLFLTIIFCLLKDVAFGSADYLSFKYIKTLDAGNISNCFLIRESFCYFFSIIVGFVFYNLYSKYSGENDYTNQSSQNLEINNSIRKATGELELIYSEQEIRIYPSTKLVLIIFLWVFQEEFIAYFKNVMLQLDFWMLELIAVHFLMKKIFKKEAYDHQKLMLWFCAVPFILKLTTIILPFYDDNNVLKKEDEKDKYKYSKSIDKLKIIYVAEPFLLSIGLLLYFVLIFFRAYVITKIKWLIDLKFISSNKIFILYNFVGFIFCISISIIATFIPCNSSNKIEGFYTIKDYFCSVKYNDRKYLDNFIVYFKGLNFNDDAKYEIIALIFGVIFFCFYKFFCLKIIEFLSPVYFIFSFPIYYIFNKIYLLVLNIIKNKDNYILDIGYAKEKLILDFISDIVSVIGYLIYLEIIELHFCKFDYNIRRNINDRGDLDANKNEIEKSNKSSSFSSSQGQNNSEEEKEISL